MKRICDHDKFISSKNRVLDNKIEICSSFALCAFDNFPFITRCYLKFITCSRDVVWELVKRTKRKWG